MIRNNKYVIGVIGGSGSGKTYIGKHITSVLDGLFIEADVVGHEVIKQPHIIDLIVREFGQEVLAQDQIDRKKLGAIVFADEEKRRRLNNIMHTAMYDEIEREILQTEKKYIVLEAAVMIEAGFSPLTDRLLLIVADDPIKRERLITQRGIDPAKADQLIGLMRSDLEAYADDLLDTTYGTLNIKEEIDRLILAIKEAYNEKNM